KVSTSLSELVVAKENKWRTQPELETVGEGNPEHHRGRVKVRLLQKSLRDKIFDCKDAGSFWRVLRGWTDPRQKPVQVSLDDLTGEFRKRMNEPVEAPASFNKDQLNASAELFTAMSRTNEDKTPLKSFSRTLTL
ncbi:hypothetical protein C8R43DRAFT_823435, partial [Mycena crocata]